MDTIFYEIHRINSVSKTTKEVFIYSNSDLSPNIKIKNTFVNLGGEFIRCVINDEEMGNFGQFPINP